MADRTGRWPNPNFVFLRSNRLVAKRQYVVGPIGARTERLGESWRYEATVATAAMEMSATFDFLIMVFLRRK